jgi:hypothetical protein
MRKSCFRFGCSNSRSPGSAWCWRHRIGDFAKRWKYRAINALWYVAGDALCRYGKHNWCTITAYTIDPNDCPIWNECTHCHTTVYPKTWGGVPWQMLTRAVLSKRHHGA